MFLCDKLAEGASAARPALMRAQLCSWWLPAGPTPFHEDASCRGAWPYGCHRVAWNGGCKHCHTRGIQEHNLTNHELKQTAEACCISFGRSLKAGLKQAYMSQSPLNHHSLRKVLLTKVLHPCGRKVLRPLVRLSFLRPGKSLSNAHQPVKPGPGLDTQEEI